jgi:hypothetical protein
MKEMIINIPEESSTLVTELVEKLGGSVKPSEKKSAGKKKKGKAVEHDFLFGKWKDFDIDARKLREELWRRD